MEGAGSSQEKDCGVLGGLFQTVVNDMRGSSPIWEDFTYKSMKLHTSLKTTVVAIGAFLEAFQKVADMATSSKGATREIGSALTRLCMRHRSIESHLKVLTSSILDNLVAPLQEKLEDWKKSVAQIDKDHAKEYKKAKQEIKKAASDTMRLQKKVRKGGGGGGRSEMQQKLDIAMADVNSKYQHLEETEKGSLRTALIEERSRFCHFIACLKPFVDNELKLLTEMTHINEIMDSLCNQASEPGSLPPSSEQVILDLKGVDNSAWNISQQGNSPPSSPSSLGSRKSSMCSINSINSSSSGSSKSHSPSHTMHKRTASQPPMGAIRLTSVSSQDSGFTSQDTLFLRPNTPQSLNLLQTSATAERDEGDCDSTPTTPSDNTPSASSTWNNWPNLPGATRSSMDAARPHTISSAYEKGHARPALKPDMFEPPQESVEMRPKPTRTHSTSSTGSNSSTSSQHRPSATISKLQPVLPPHCPKPKVKAVAPPTLPPGAQPIYANTAELAGRSSDSSPDDNEPTTPTTPASVSVTQAPQHEEAIKSPKGLMDLDQALQQMDLCTAALHVEFDSPEAADDTSEEVTPRASVDDPKVKSREGEEADEVLVEISRPKIQQNTSLELAKAIRELEASTAALNSAYDNDPYPNNLHNTNVNPAATVGPVNANSNSTVAPMSGGGYDADSYTSKTSLQCSSGYGTMNSTPAGSEDTIASGGAPKGPYEAGGETEPPLPEGIREEGEMMEGESCIYEELDDQDLPPPPEELQSEKYYTIPRSGEVSEAYRMALQSQRPASTAGIPVSGSNISRRSSVNNQPKPPPPVRRTASVTGAPPTHVQKMRNSPPKQMSADHAYQYPPGDVPEGPYAELQLIQQNIHGQGPPVRQGPPTPSKPNSTQRQLSDNPALYQYHGPQPDATTLQSLNAKFASLNSQYKEGSEVDGGDYDRREELQPGQKRAPPVMQKPNKQQSPQQQPHGGGYPHPLELQHHPGHKHPGASGANHHPHHHPVVHTPGHHYPHSPHHHPQQQHHLHQQQQQQNWHGQPHHSHQQQQYYDSSQQQPHPLQHSEDDFPMPPTAEELQEMERIYSRPPPIGPSIRAPQHQNAAQQKPHHHPQQQHPQAPHLQQQQPGGVQASLMQELKRRVSVDDTSNA